MTDPIGDTTGTVVSRASSTKRRRHTLDDLVAIVRPAGKPSLVRAFARDELDQARQYAAEHDTEVEMLTD